MEYRDDQDFVGLRAVKNRVWEVRDEHLTDIKVNRRVSLRVGRDAIENLTNSSDESTTQTGPLPVVPINGCVEFEASLR